MLDKVAAVAEEEEVAVVGRGPDGHSFALIQNNLHFWASTAPKGFPLPLTNDG